MFLLPLNEGMDALAGGLGKSNRHQLRASPLVCGSIPYIASKIGLPSTNFLGLRRFFSSDAIHGAAEKRSDRMDF
jgi:hypothetical protein